jgi:hypothetical protein
VKRKKRKETLQFTTDQSTDDNGGNYVKWNNTGIRKHVALVLSYMWNLK